MNEANLEKLGLKEKEIALYQAVLKNGPSTPVSLSRMLGIKRTTCYSLARGLAEKGLLFEDTSARPRTFAAATANDVLALIGEEKKRALAKEEVLKAVAEELAQAAERTRYPVPTLRFVDEKKLGRFLRQEMPVWDKSMLVRAEPAWWGFQDHTFVEHFGDWIREYWEQASQEIGLNLLSNRAESEVKFSGTVTPRRVIKYWGEAALFRSTLWAIGDYVVMINTRTRPFYLVEIHDELMANDQREVFKNLWPLV